MAQNKFKGLGIALITPFKSDGEVDYEALTRLVEYQIQNGVDFLCIMGTTAETPCLSADEKKILKKKLSVKFSAKIRRITLWLSSALQITAARPLSSKCR